MREKVCSLNISDERIWSVASHPSLPLIAVASADRVVKIYRVDTSNNSNNSSNNSSESIKCVLLTTLSSKSQHSRSIRTIAWRPKQFPVLATGSFDATVSVWAPLSCSENKFIYDINNTDQEWDCIATLEGHENEVKSVAWSSNGTHLASSSRDKSVWIWECYGNDDENGYDNDNDGNLELELEFECVSVLQDHSQDVKCIDFHLIEEDLLASASYDDSVRLYRDDPDEEDWTCTAVLESPHSSTIWCVKFEQPPSISLYNGIPRLVSASEDKKVRVWTKKVDDNNKDKNTNDNNNAINNYNNVEDMIPSLGRIPNTYKTHSMEEEWYCENELPLIHTRSVYTVSWSKNSGRIASAGGDGSIVIYKEDKDSSNKSKWSIEKTIHLAHGVYEINTITWLNVEKDKELLISGGDDGNVYIWDL